MLNDRLVVAVLGTRLNLVDRYDDNRLYLNPFR